MYNGSEGKKMAMSNAERQRRYREKHAGKKSVKKTKRAAGKIYFNAVRLAGMLGVTDWLIRYLAQAGILEPEPESRDRDGAKYDIEKNVPLFIEYLKNKYRQKSAIPQDDGHELLDLDDLGELDLSEFDLPSLDLDEDFLNEIASGGICT
jgi:hypothetical protein